MSKSAEAPHPEKELQIIAAQLRHAYEQLVNGRVKAENHIQFAIGLIAPQIARLEKLAASSSVSAARLLRYAIVPIEVHYDHIVCNDIRVEEHAEGDWVKWDDVKALTDALASAIAERDEARAEWHAAIHEESYAGTRDAWRGRAWDAEARLESAIREVEQLKRYDLELCGQYYYTSNEMMQREAGDWVRVEDVLTILRRAEKEQK